MQTSDFPETLQEFIYAMQYGKCATIEITDVLCQTKILDYFIQLLDHFASQSRSCSSDLKLHPDFFLLPNTEPFFTQLFASLDLSLRPKVDELFQRTGTFIASFIGNQKNISVINRLAEKLKERFPHLSELLNESIARIVMEFFRHTVGDFLDAHKTAEEHLKAAFPTTHALFVAPLNTELVRNCKLFNFYCNPWIYQRIMNYLALHACLHQLPERSCDHIEMRLRWLEERLLLIHSQTTDESWQELTQKAYDLCKARNNLEEFANQSSGLLGEITAAAFIIKNYCHLKDVLIFLPDANRQKKKWKNCDLMIIRHGIDEQNLVEVATKSPRHGLDPEDAADAQTWDDFFSNFSDAIYSYLLYLQKIIPHILGLKLTKCFPLLSAYEGSDYGVPLPIINDVLAIHPATKNPSNNWSSEQKLEHILQTTFFRPLVLDDSYVPLASDNVRLESRQQATRDALKKDWVENIIRKKTRQLEEAHRNKKTEGNTISKLYVALNLGLSYRLLQDPLSRLDGNIQETADKTLHEIFQPFKDEFAAKGLELELLLVKL